MIFAASSEVTQRVEGTTTKEHSRAWQSSFCRRDPSVSGWSFNINLLLSAAE